MGKEAKIGLTVILVLLVALGVVLYGRLGGGHRFDNHALGWPGLVRDRRPKAKG